MAAVRLYNDRTVRGAASPGNCILIIRRRGISNPNRVPWIGRIERVLNAAVRNTGRTGSRAGTILINIEDGCLRF
jgi:hypothetical protein